MPLAVLCFVAVGASQPREFAAAAESVTIGSAAGNDFVIRDATASRRHATFARVANGYQLADLGSTNGTFVNGRRIAGPVFVRAGDEVRFGTAAYVLREGAADRVAPKVGSAAPAAAVPARSRRRSAAAVFAALLIAAGFTFYQFVTNFSRLENARTTEAISKKTAVMPMASGAVHSLDTTAGRHRWRLRTRFQLPLPAFHTHLRPHHRRPRRRRLGRWWPRSTG